MVSPAMLRPSRLSSAVTTELSTPPDMATAIRSDMGHLGRYAAQVGDAGLDRFDQAIHLFLCVAWTERKTDAGTRLFRLQSHGEQHMGGLHRAAGAGRSAGNRVTAQVERDHDGLAFNSVEADVRGVGQAGVRQTIDMRTFHATQDAGFQAVAEICD